MKILITGGFGFLGSNLIRKLLSEGHDITIIDDLSTGTELKSRDITFFNLNADDPKCNKIFESEKFDVVIHLAFKGYNKEVFKTNNENTFSNNVSLNNILNISLRHRVEKFILISSFKVYGKRMILPFTEMDIPTPLDGEGESYLGREIIANEYKNLGLNIIKIRTGAVYGPGQYGSDISFVKSEQKSIGDLIYIDDFTEAVSKVIISNTDEIINLSNGEGDSNIMDSFRMKVSNDFFPKTNWKEGEILAYDRILENKRSFTPYEDKLKVMRESKYKDLEIGILFILAFILNYIFKFKLGINIDLFILYIVLVSIFFGLKGCITSIFLSIISYIWFSYSYENKTILMFIKDVDRILYITSYFIIGTSIGFYMDEKRKKEHSLKKENERLKEDILFVTNLYNKSLQIKGNLRDIIENYDNNLSNINNIIEKIGVASAYEIEEIIPSIFQDNFNSKSVSLYIYDEEENSLSIKSYIGTNKLEDYIIINESEFIQNIIDEKEVFINKSLDDNKPRIGVPLLNERKLWGVIFLDDINFKYLNQLYINKIKLTSRLISNFINQSYRYQRS